MAKKDFKAAINQKTNIGEKSGIKNVFASTTEEPKTTKTIKEIIPSKPINEEPTEHRQTFIIKSDYFDKLKDYVYYKRVHTDEDAIFTQKEALHEALDLLFEQAGEIVPRPNRVRLLEQKRSDNIKKRRAAK